MFWNQVEKRKKKGRKRESWIKKKRERFWNLVEKEVGKKGEDGNKSGHTCMVEKKQEKKKEKKKERRRNVWTKERKNNIKNKK